jgi:hypothetical protein
MLENLPIGTVIDHDLYGKGVIYQDNITSYSIIFSSGGERQIAKKNAEIEVIQTPENAQTSEIDIDAFEKIIKSILDQYGLLPDIIELGERWIGGTMILKPADDSLKSKEIPIENFFHKIVMIRDRLRVLEQNINSNNKLTDEEKINIQQYITRIYGSLTTFNILFANKEDFFIGQKS